MLFESFCTNLGGKIDGLFGFFIGVAYILMIAVGLPALLIKVFILN